MVPLLFIFKFYENHASYAESIGYLLYFLKHVKFPPCLLGKFVASCEILDTLILRSSDQRRPQGCFMDATSGIYGHCGKIYAVADPEKL